MSKFFTRYTISISLDNKKWYVIDSFYVPKRDNDESVYQIWDFKTVAAWAEILENAEVTQPFYPFFKKERATFYSKSGKRIKVDEDNFSKFFIAFCYT